MPSARTKNVCGGADDLQRRPQSRVLSASCGYRPAEQLGELDGAVRTGIVVVDPHDHQVGLVGAAPPRQMNGASSRHGPHHCAQMLIIIGWPRKPGQPDVPAAAQARQDDVGQAAGDRRRRRHRTPGSPRCRPPSSAPPVRWRRARRRRGAGGRPAAAAVTGGDSRSSRPAARAASQPATSSGRPSPHPRGSRTSLAALTGSVSPSPYDGHQRATGQAPQAGLRAWQRRRPCQITWWQSCVQSLRREQRADLGLDLVRVGLGGPAEAADQPAEVGVHGDARARRRRCPAPRWPSCDPTPGSVTSSASVSGTSPSNRSTSAAPSLIRCRSWPGRSRSA